MVQAVISAATSRSTFAPGVTPNAADTIGKTLSPGQYLIGLRLPKLATADVVSEVLERLGFDEVLLDRSTLRNPSGSIQHFVIARTCEALTLPSSSLTWSYIRKLAADAFGETPLRSMGITPVEPDVSYELRFLVRLRVHGRREAVEQALRTMGTPGFVPEALIAVRRNVRTTPDSAPALVRWHGIARWEGLPACVTSDEDVYFERVIPRIIPRTFSREEAHDGDPVLG